ncbi:MAG TPA: penicillin acylase family protein [Polyangiaceae bacterium]|jgi:penicillin amidase
MAEILGPNGIIPYTRDALGYPAIRAQSASDGVYALGYLHALDRLVQITLTAYAARGELMSVLGDLPIARLVDNSVRVLGIHTGNSEQVARCNSESQALLHSYAAGFNAGARQRGRPLVLRLLGIESREFRPENVLEVYRFITYFGLTSITVSTKLIVAELAARGAPRRVFDRLLGPLAQGIDLEALTSLRLPKSLSFFESALGGSPRAGSNAFAVAGRRSSSGGALLMGEFHMETDKFPPLFYPAEISCGAEGSLCGMTIPGCLWFAAGRTEHVGWSYTFGHGENVEFACEHVRAGQYQRGQSYRPLVRREERVRIKRKPSETWVFHESDRGVVVGDASGEADLVCVRVTGIDEAHRAFSAATRLLRCKTVHDLLEVQREIKSVSLEAILVDSSGSIASIATGSIVERPSGYTGAYPALALGFSDQVPGVVPESERPIALDPPEGFLVSANQGGQGPHVARWCAFPEAPYRSERITELLAVRERHTPESLLRVSYDTFDRGAARMLRAWSRLLPDEPLAKQLSAWAEIQKDRDLLRFYGKLYEETCFLLLEEDLPRADARRFREWSALAIYQSQLDRVLALEHPELLDEQELKTLLARAFTVAKRDYREHDVPVKLRFAHSVTRGRTPAFLGFDSPEIELPASPDAPFQCRVSPISGERLIYAPAFHLLMDMSRPGAWYNIPGGASESRFGPGYGKGVDDWLHGTMHPLGSAQHGNLSLR